MKLLFSTPDSAPSLATRRDKVYQPVTYNQNSYWRVIQALTSLNSAMRSITTFASIRVLGHCFRNLSKISQAVRTQLRSSTDEVPCKMFFIYIEEFDKRKIDNVREVKWLWKGFCNIMRASVRTVNRYPWSSQLVRVDFATRKLQLHWENIFSILESFGHLLHRSRKNQ